MVKLCKIALTFVSDKQFLFCKIQQIKEILVCIDAYSAIVWLNISIYSCFAT